VFKNRVLGKIFGPKKGKMTGGWSKFQNEEVHDISYVENIIGLIKTRRMK
jgi:hypothetical protein